MNERVYGVHIVHSVMPPHAPAEFTSVTRSGSIGVSFTSHRRAVRQFATAPIDESDIPAGAAFVTTSADLLWLDVTEPSEALEVHLDPSYVQRVGAELGASRPVSLGDVGAKADPVIWAICADLRAMVQRGAPLESLGTSERVYALTTHALHAYGDLPPERRRRASLLDQARLTRVTQYIDAHLGTHLVLEQLADVAALSPFHFARSFRATTGLAPYAFVTARRMERARRLLLETALPAAAVASRVGFTNIAHFREQFVRAFGARPSALRARLGTTRHVATDRAVWVRLPLTPAESSG